MSFLILVRHGQSTWNLEKRFTGWVDVDLTDKGKLEAEKAGVLIREKKINIDTYYSSLQLRAKNTLKIIQKTLNDKKKFTEAWQLNERHYGALTGLNKEETSKKLGEKKVHEFRRSWDIRPEPLDKKSPLHPVNIDIYKELPKEIIPNTESLKDTYKRVVTFYESNIKKQLINNNVLISAHGNSLRALIMYLEKISEDAIVKLEIATGQPIFYQLDEDLQVVAKEIL